MNTDAVTAVLGNIAQQVGTFLPNIAGALGILLGGWIVAIIISRLIGAAIRKTPLNAKLSGLFPSTGGRAADASRPIAKIVYYLIMLFALIAFFNTLNLPVVSEPLNKFLSQIFEYAPRLFGAGALGLIAWVVARVVKTVTHQGIVASDLDNRVMGFSSTASSVTRGVANTIDRAVGAEPTDHADPLASAFETVDEPLHAQAAPRQATATGSEGMLSKTIPDTAYYLVWLLFIPGILGALQMPALLEPVQSLIASGTEFLPKLIAAIAILAIGFFIAKIVSQIITNLAATAGADNLAQRFGVSQATGATSVSGLLGVIVKAAILFPVLIASLNALSIDAITQPAMDMLNKITALIPGVMGGIIVVGIAYFVGNIVSGLIRDVLSGMGADTWPAKLGLSNAGNVDVAGLVGRVVQGVMVFFAIVQALPMMGLDVFAEHANTLVGFAMRVVVGLVLVALGFWLANLSAETIKKSGMENAHDLAGLARGAVMLMALGMGIQQMGFAPNLVNLVFGALALAAAIAFGWGGRDAAKRILDRYVA
jgi:hypothetical protein